MCILRCKISREMHFASTDCLRLCSSSSCPIVHCWFWDFFSSSRPCLSFTLLPKNERWQRFLSFFVLPCFSCKLCFTVWVLLRRELFCSTLGNSGSCKIMYWSKKWWIAWMCYVKGDEQWNYEQIFCDGQCKRWRKMRPSGYFLLLYFLDTLLMFC